MQALGLDLAWSEVARRSLRAHARAGARTLRLPLARLCKVLASKEEWVLGRGGGGVCSAVWSAPEGWIVRRRWVSRWWALCCCSRMQAAGAFQKARVVEGERCWMGGLMEKDDMGGQRQSFAICLLVPWMAVKEKREDLAGGK